MKHQSSDANISHITMATLNGITVLLALLSTSTANTETPCSTEDCGYVTMNLDQKREATIFSLSSESIKVEAPAVTMKPKIDYSEAMSELSENFPDYETTTPIKNGFFFRSYPTGIPSIMTTVSLNVLDLSEYVGTGSVNDPFHGGTLDLTDVGMKGEDVKWFFDSISNRRINVTKEVGRLYLTRNNIRYLPSLVFPISLEYGLHELRMDENNLSYLTGQTLFEISRLHNLKFLNLARNGLLYLDPLYIPSLEELNLSGNRLSYVSSSLKNLPSLQRLDLSNNHITSVSSFPLKALVNLRVLSLASNNLRYIRDNPFKNPNRLGILNLSYNKLKSMSNLESIDPKILLYLSGNPWECSCLLLTTTRQPHHNVTDLNTIMCAIGDINKPQLLSLMSEREVHKICPGTWDWFMDRAEQLENVARWFRRRGIHESTVVNFLWWLSLGVVAVAGILVVRWHYKGRVVTTMPYTIRHDEKILM